MAHPRISEVENFVKNNKVAVFMKGTADFPMCGFSARAVAVLKHAGVEKPASFDVLSDHELWGALEEFTQWPTVPQVFINGKFIGGSDIVTEMHERGELTALLT
jgi:monothiol glutaredoxin